MTLYSKKGGEPQALPPFDRDDHGDTWTNLDANEAGRIACGWVEAPGAPDYNPDAGSLAWEGGAWLVTPFTAEELTARLAAEQAARLAELADWRWQHQQVMQFNGAAMPADDITIGRCTAAQAYAQQTGLDPDAPRNWKLGPGQWATLSTNQIIAYGVAIGTHLQACFDREKALSDQLMAAHDIASLRAIDITSDWPA